MADDAASTGFRSTWLPHDQEHAVGRKAFFDLLRGDLHRGEEWTDDGRPGDLAMSTWQVLAPGTYTAVLQVWSRHSGAASGTFIVEADGGRTLAEQPVVTGDPDFGDWQRVLVSFRLDAATRVRLRFHYDRTISIWTGSMHLSRGGPRPIYLIGHNRNTPAQVDRSLDLGANAIEVDLSYRHGRIMAAEVPPLPGWKDISEADVWLRHLQAQCDRWAMLYVDCKLHEVPDKDHYRYGGAIASLIRDAGVDPKRCLFSVPDPSGVDVHRGVADGGFRESSFGMDGIDHNQPLHAEPDDWASAAARYRLQVIGMGRTPLEVVKPLALWWRSVAATTGARDAGGPSLRKVIFWSLQEKAGMRKILDLGVDGIIVDREDHASEVLAEEPYRTFCRKALPGEWDPFHAFGATG